MKQKRHSRIVFKDYNQNQPQLLPPSLDELIPENHLVRFVNRVIDNLDINLLIGSYKGGGCSAYHPKMLLKVLVYAYCDKVYSSRRIAKQIRENIHYMWLAGGNRPDFRTINRFRSSRLKGVLEEVFTIVMRQLIELGYVSLADYYVDGTKIEANANKYSYVWRKTTEKNKERLQEKIKELYEQIEAVNEEEERIYKDKDLAELGEEVKITSEKVKELKESLEARLKEFEPGEEKKTIEKNLKKLEKDYLPRLEKYEKQEKLLGDRNSYSKTDPDATFMRMKDDPMKNRSLRAGYNVQIGTNNQYIVHYSIHQNSSDSPTFIPHLEGLKERYSEYPLKVIADAGYGSEENYYYLDQAGILGYVKYNTFYQEQKKKLSPFRIENLKYDEAKDVYICPNEKALRYLKSKFVYSTLGFRKLVRIYESEDCTGCPMREECHSFKSNRRIKVNVRLNKFKHQARSLLESEEGILYRKKRGIEPESVFGQLKQNFGLRRFQLRGKEKVQLEFGLFALAHNLKKWWKNERKNPPIPGIKYAFLKILYFTRIFTRKFNKYLVFEFEY